MEPDEGRNIDRTA